mmetsp:Transcript_106592/g.343942  ORF Transcript_106592/g.343942 Transcript_106592/m.343942 type:complete len:258 (+) Transcript_106592:268-1041(+)
MLPRPLVHLEQLAWLQLSGRHLQLRGVLAVRDVEGVGQDRLLGHLEKVAALLQEESPQVARGRDPALEVVLENPGADAHHVVRTLFHRPSEDLDNLMDLEAAQGPAVLEAPGIRDGGRLDDPVVHAEQPRKVLLGDPAAAILQEAGKGRGQGLRREVHLLLLLLLGRGLGLGLGLLRIDGLLGRGPGLALLAGCGLRGRRGLAPVLGLLRRRGPGLARLPLQQPQVHVPVGPLEERQELALVDGLVAVRVDFIEQLL